MNFCSHSFHQSPSQTRRPKVQWSLGFCLILLSILTGGASILVAPPETRADEESATVLIRQAATAADQAWEEFHRAAIGGTLASPALQVHIEQQLHEVRALLMEARKAERAKQTDSVKQLTRKIFDITDNIIQASREKKL